MPTENEKAATAADDKELKALKAEVAALTDQLAAKDKELEAAATRLSSAEKKLKDAKSAPLGNTCTLDGKTYPVIGRVSPRFAGDEARKGHIDLEEELIVIKWGAEVD